MYEFEAINYATNERKIMYGITFGDACKRKGLKVDDWKVVYRVYID